MDLRRELTPRSPWRGAPARVFARCTGSGLAVDTKDDDSPVTQADREANALIVAALTAAFPDDGHLQRGAARRRLADGRTRVWMVDPLDGTKDFIRGREGSRVMIGLLDGASPALGVVYQPIGDKLYLRDARRRRLDAARAAAARRSGCT